MKYCVAIWALIFIVSCSFNKGDVKKDKFLLDDKVSMDNLETIPEWLQFEVSNSLPSDSLNLWIPTGKLETSSLIRVPRFPVQYSQARLDSSVFDLSRYDIKLIEDTLQHKISALKNEQVSAQIAVAAKQHIEDLTVMVGDFISDYGDKISADNVKVRYAKYVPVHRARSELSWTGKPEEIFGPEVFGFGAPDLVADPLMEMSKVYVPAYRAQPIWFTFFVPKNVKSGIYRGTISIETKEFSTKVIPIAIDVSNNQIPDAEDYEFFLDLWLNPNAIAVAHQVQLWTEEHWILIEKYMQDLVSRGAKTITTTITHDPWQIDWLNGKKRSQTGIGYAPMIQWNLMEANTWTYDYSVFDTYVDLALKTGLSERIDVFSLTPFEWEGKRYVTYFDNAKKEMIETAFDQSDREYELLWIQFLKDFEKHLKEKGWFEKTYLSFDESPKHVIASILKIVKEGAPDFLNRFSIAGKPHTSDMANAMSIFYPHFKPQYNKEKPIGQVLLERKQSRKTTTWYLCGDPAHPNTFSYSPAIESRLIPWLTLKLNVDGYLRWAYNSWPDKDPFKNPVFNYIQGDDYYVYPGKQGPISSIRWELLKEGIEDVEFFNVIKKKNKIPINDLKKSITYATQDEDGRFKEIDDFVNARNILLGNSDNK
ncbi:DUF4091 domain-containing protein [Flagellimonas pacifica]|uniref:Uncharacterized protein n=1 Tax=Flagellimonas pacifica TaxID=1247520 RepID=A0A285MS42_9FLAO|nr:DUF4091 domain-containing protein [Allomuricauda parva]SNY99503.1 protein of unknown function [Allomuricauda parva]